jgi:hypothetical protein
MIWFWALEWRNRTSFVFAIGAIATTSSFVDVVPWLRPGIEPVRMDYSQSSGTVP